MSITIKQALAEAQHLKEVSGSWQLDAELLLCHALGQSREYLFTWPEKLLNEQALENYRSFLQRRGEHEPVAYITGRKAFWDFELSVNSSVLVPRPETELLVESALQLLADKQQQSLRIADLGTGSGAIAIALAKSRPAWQLDAVDISEKALPVAAANAQTLAIGNIEFHIGSWCDGLPAQEYDMIIANPPYVAEGDAYLKKGDLPFEPIIALQAADFGLGSLVQIIRQSKEKLKKDSWLLLEHGFDQKDDLLKLLLEEGYVDVENSADYAGLDRMMKARWPGAGTE